MNFRLLQKYALRSWKKLGTVLLNRETSAVEPLSFMQFITLNQCDGTVDLDEIGPLLRHYEQRGVVERCEPGDAIEEEQQFRTYSNEYFPVVKWAVTNRCNYRCRHCFMDSAMDKEEPTFLQCLDLIEQFAECGIGAVHLTGGEPLIRSDILDILEKLREKHIRITAISTNGALADQNFLDALKSLDIQPAFVVSFDGIGCHNWLRGVETAEEATLATIRRVIANGFQVYVEMSVHQGNLHSVLETADTLNGMGISELRTIRVSESPRWQKQGMQKQMSYKEFYDESLDLLSACFDNKWQIDMRISGFATYLHKSDSCTIWPLNPNKRGFDPLCWSARTVVFISGDGRLLPCNPFSSMTKDRENWGNVLHTPLRKLLSESAYLDIVNADIPTLTLHNAKCRECQWLRDCRGGCRACAYCDTGDYFAADPSKCAFFEDGYADKIRTIAGNRCV